MRILSVSLCAALLFLPGLALGASPSQQPEKVEIGIDVQKVADGVYAAIRKEVPAVFVDANTLFIVNDEDVIVVDANVTPGSTRECLAALRKITDKPVRYVINTHWHQDHVAGNQVYREAFPGVEFIAHTRTRTELIAKAEETRKLYLTQGPTYAKRLRDAVAKNESFYGTPMTPDERVSYSTAATLVERYISEAPGMKTVLPTITVEDSLVLHRGGGRTIEIRYMGRGHTDKDLVVFLPKEGVLATGDLVVAPVPLMGDQSFIGDWGPTLDRLRALNPKVIVPGHGPVLHDDSYLKSMAELASYIARETKAAAARGETLEQARKSVNLQEFRKRFAGESMSLRLIFGDYVAGAAVAQAYAEATAKP